MVCNLFCDQAKRKVVLETLGAFSHTCICLLAKPSANVSFLPIPVWISIKKIKSAIEFGCSFGLFSIMKFIDAHNGIGGRSA